MPDDNLRYLSTAEKTALALWRGKIETALSAGGEVYTELMLWLRPMGVVYSSGQLSFPASVQSTRAAPWTGIERYFNYVHASMRGITNYGAPYFNRSKYTGRDGYLQLLAIYPAGLSILTVLNALYNRIDAVLKRNNITGPQTIIGGMLVLFETFAVWGTKWWESDYYWSPFYVAHAGSGTVGPYTVTVNYCENGVIFGIVMDEPMHIAHQSVDADLLIQDEGRTTINATELLSAEHRFDLAADTALQGKVTQELDVDLALMGEEHAPLLASVAMRDEVKENLAADGLLAVTHSFDLSASLHLIAAPRVGLDADMCIIGPATKTLAAYMLLLPDSAPEILTDLEKYHIQAMRIRADPRSYKVYNSKTDTEVIP
ncbi:MAG: hypothetical protein WC560_13050 [Syntrophales bacterium]